MSQPRPEELKRFLELLMESAPEGYSPWLFKCRPGRKDPIRGISWKNPRHCLTVEQGIKWMEQGGNVGIAGMKNDPLVNVDLDGQHVDKSVLKPTLTSRSRSRTGIHGFYFTKDKTTIPNIPTDNDGEVRSQGQYVVAPGSYVTTDPEKVPEDQRENAGYYTVEDARAPAWIEYNDLPQVFRDKKTQDEDKPTAEPSRFDPKKTGGKHSAVFDITAREIAAREGGDTNPHERWGSIFHDSETDANMSLSDRGLLQCWRHNVSLNGLQALAVLSGFMTCEEAGTPHKDSDGSPSAVTGNNAAIFHAWRFAKDAGYIVDDDPIPTRAMHYIAEKYLGYKAGENEKLPTHIFRGVLEAIEKEYPGLNPGRIIPESYEKEKKDLIEKALDTLAPYSFKTPDDVEALYLFREGEYILGEPFVKGLLETTFGTKTSTGLCGEVINHLKRRSYVSRKTFNRFEGEIPVLNGLLNLKTGTLSPFTPDKIFTFKIQAKYDENAECPKFEKFMGEVLPDNEDRLSIQEYSGYTLSPRLSFHKIAFLVGRGRNGKGVYLRTQADILGPDNVSNIRLDHLNGGHRFIATNLYGKLMNVSSEPSTRWPLQTELLKALTGEDWLDGEVKNKQNPIRFQPFAKHFVQANKLPKVTDTSLGWWDRVLLIFWDQTFTEEQGNQIKDLEDTWLNDEKERSGILNWLLKGLHRLNTQGRFTQSKTQKEAMIQFKRASDPIGAFLAEEVEYDADFYILREPLYESYKDYAKSLNADVEGNRVFFERIRQVPGVNVDRKKRINNKNERVVTGLQLKERGAPDTLDDYSSDESDEPSPKTEGGADGADGALQVSRQKTISTEVEGVEQRREIDVIDNAAPSAPSAPLLAEPEAGDAGDASPAEKPPRLAAPKKPAKEHDGRAILEGMYMCGQFSHDPGKVLKLVDEAVGQGVFSDAQLAEAIGIDLESVRKLMRAQPFGPVSRSTVDGIWRRAP